MKRLPGILASVVCALGIGTGTSAAATCSPTLFIQAVEYPAGGPAADFAVGDFDGDGSPDVVVANGNNATVSVLLNAGDGTFGPPIVTPFGQTALAVAAADLRGNGTMDAIVATYSQVGVLLGHGDGTFDDPVFYPAGVGTIQSLLVGKFDANGSWDLIVTTQYDTRYSFLPGNVNGTFGAPVVTDSSMAISGATAADLDEDAHLDLIVSSRDAGVVSFLRGRGDGTFDAPVSYVAGTGLAGLVAANLNDDQHLDVAVVSEAAVSVLIGNGAGAFEAALQYPSGIQGGRIVAADLDQDLTLDLVVSSAADFYGGGNQVSVLHGIGDGRFAPGDVYFVGRSGAIASADVNADSFPDVLTSAATGQSLSVLLDTPTGALLAIPDSPLIGPPSSVLTTSGDWNGDDRLDFAWGNYGGISVVQADLGGRYTQTDAISISQFGWQVTGMTSGRFHYGLPPDLVASTFGDLLLAAGNGDGTFQDPVSVVNGSQFGAITAGGFDGDGSVDLAVYQGCCGSGSIVVYPGNGDGTFQPPVPTPFAFDASLLLPANLNGDADADLVAVTNGALWILVSNGDGSLTATDTIPTNGNASVAAGEFGSGATDLLVSDNSGHVSLYPGHGDGTFGAPVLVALPAAGGSVTAGDYDGDGNGDFAVNVNGRVLVFLGFGGGQFHAPFSIGGASSSALLVTGSISGGGRDDIAILDPTSIAAVLNSHLAATARGGGHVDVESTVVFKATASGYGPVSYQWRKDGIFVSDGPHIQGAMTDTLTIDPISFADAGDYDVLVTDSCQSVPSNSVALSVEFADVPISSPFHDDILTIATAGITGGCGGANYCPASLVRRDQMAVFLLKSEHGSGYTPPACTGVFADVPCPSPFADWVEQLATEGITGGCGAGNFCPDGSVTRAQMAVFLLKTSQGSSYTPPAATGIFGDVPVGSFAADFIEDLYSRGITGGCSASPLLYCPGSSVSRQQMATFIVRTFGL